MENDFTNPLTYSVTAADNTTKDYAVSVTPENLTHRTYIKAPNNSAGDRFGMSVAMSGDTLVVGAQYEDSDLTNIIHGNDLSTANAGADDSGAVYVYVRDGSTWTHQAYLKAPNSLTGIRFGSMVAIEGDTIVVGAPYESSDTTSIIHGSDLGPPNTGSSESGAVYVFVRNGTTWSHQAYLKAPNNDSSDWFGSTVVMSGDTVVVGAAGENGGTTTIIHGSDLSSTDDTAADSGAAYVFVRDGVTWSHQAYLKAPNNSAGIKFGRVAISGNTIASAASYETSDTTAIIHGSDLSSTNVAASFCGAVYVFVRNGTVWSHEAYLKAPNGEADDYFGTSVAIVGDTIVATANSESSDTTGIIHGSDLSSTNNGGNDYGAVYVFVRDGTTWSHQAYLKAPNPTNNDIFGNALFLVDNTFAVGVYAEDSDTTDIIQGNDLSSTNNSGNDNGAVYVYERNGSTWSHKAYLKSPNNSNSDYFNHVAIVGETIIVGADQESSDSTAIIHDNDFGADNENNASSGAVYIFQ